jgi:nucleotide-binding universal stress UspA family protein
VVELEAIRLHLPVNHMQHVLCAIDMGETSEQALREADRVARLHGARLTVLHVLPDGYPGVPMSPLGTEQALLEQQRLTREVGDYIDELVARATGRSGHDQVELEIEGGTPHDMIVDAAVEGQADLIVIGATGTGAVGLLGSVARHVARHAPVSVLVVRARRVDGPVIAATDFSEEAEYALQVAVEEARARHTRLIVAHSLELAMPEVAAIGDPGVTPSVTMASEYYEAALPMARARLSQVAEGVPVPAEPVVVQEPPPEGLVTFAARIGADLLVVGAPHRSALGRIVLGDVGTALVRDAPCSVLVNRPPTETRH